MPTVVGEIVTSADDEKRRKVSEKAPVCLGYMASRLTF